MASRSRRGGGAYKARAAKGGGGWRGTGASQGQAAYWSGWDATGAAAATETLLDALAPGSAEESVSGQVMPHHGKMDDGKHSMWLVADPRPVGETPAGLMGPEKFLGHWVDSQGNTVHVLSTDAYDGKLVATLSRPPRPDIHLVIKPVVLGGGWQCGHSLLDPLWTSEKQMHWVAMDGRVSVWVRVQESKDEEETTDPANGNADAGDAPAATESAQGGAA